ncbi:MAG: hypothetical protein M3Y86_05225, partial [Verrucomicrobiota bacterium]|nr:hypothetical protein [Verrucomicrobiota bacterium]
MKKIGLVILAGFSLLFAPGQLWAQTDDPSEVFLKAYMTSQQGEKLEHDNQFQAALVKFRFAGSLLEELRKTHAEWQPAIVDYRARKIGESILRVQSKIGTQTDLAATSQAPVLPQNAGPAEPSVEIGSTRPGEARLPSPATSTPRSARPNLPPASAPAPSAVAAAPVPAPSAPSDAAIKKATKDLQERVDQLQTDLQKSRAQYSSVQKEKESLNDKLQETNSKLTQAQSELQKTQTAEKTAHDQLAKAQDSLKKIQSSGSTDAKATAALRAEISQLKNALATAEEGRAAAEKEKDAASTKLTEANTQITSVTKERDELVAEVKNSKEAQERVQTLVAENSDLQKKLADAEKSIREITDDKPQKEQEIADVKRQVEQLHAQLAASEKKNQEYESNIGDLRTQLEDANAQLAQAKTTGANPEETARLTKENEMLRAIVMRERQEEARREGAKKLMLAEFDKLQIKSETLNQQIELLAQPVTKLSNDELALLRQPVVATSDSNPQGMTASFAIAKQGGTNKAGAENFQPGVPEELIPLARQAKEDFDSGKFRASEKIYEEILTKSPNNLYALSNLGAVYFRTGRLKAAELT